MKRILVPVDFSASSARALDYAIEFARKMNSELILLHALEPFYLPAPGNASNVELVLHEFERAARARLSQWATRAANWHISVRALVRLGTAERVIVEVARKVSADLIIMSTRGRTGVAHALIGSVAEKVVRRASCPVLTISTRKLPKKRPAS